MTMGEVVGLGVGKRGRCLSLNEVSISLAPSVVSTKILSKVCFFGKIVSSRTFTPKDVEQTCSNLWKARIRVEPTEFALAGTNTFRFIFDSGVVSKRVLENGLWCIKGDMLVLLSWSSGFGAKELSFSSIRFWVQIHFLPNDYYSKVNANVLGALAGTVVNIELDESRPVTWKPWIRVQVDVDVHRPLCSGCFFKVANGENKWIQLKYEKLGTFCYLCGLLGHQRRDCSLSSPVTVLNEQGTLFRYLDLGSISHRNTLAVSLLRIVLRPLRWVVSRKVKEKRMLWWGRFGCGRREASISGVESEKDDGVGWGRGGAQVRPAWRPKDGDGTKEIVSSLGEPSFSPILNVGKKSGLFPFSVENLNEDDNISPCMGPGGMCKVNPLTDLVNEVSCVGLKHGECGPNIVGFKNNFDGPNRVGFRDGAIGPPSLPRDGDVGSLNEIAMNKIKNMAQMGHEIGGPSSFIKKKTNVHSLLGRGQCSGLGTTKIFNSSTQFIFGNYEERGVIGSDHDNDNASLCDIGVHPTSETNERTTPVKKRRLDVESHSLKIVPKWTMRRVKCVVRDYPRGVGPRGSEPDLSCELPGSGDSEEPTLGDESSPMAVSVGVPQHMDKPISVGQSTRLTAWKARARMADITIPSRPSGKALGGRPSSEALKGRPSDELRGSTLLTRHGTRGTLVMSP
ncbi:hypothetical protein F8388_008292 [Cannabis sativa]|uniref:CCHC-type domain-containing protein n=1 Tax=Cannabis sativa TaxID=3483 RepID=A0A7J6GLX5_CANSA|nr:hypothetical protein F8388_008292 [Cannabis sativa]KAF4383925.1 hypothetical protein G4B88_016358 [Cannabis sativa]